MGSSNSTPEQTTTQPTAIPLGEKKPQSISKSNEDVKKPSSQSILSEKEMNSIISDVTQSKKTEPKSFIQECLSTYDDTVTPFLNDAQKECQQLNELYLNPIRKSYREIPEEITAFKFTYLNCYGYNERLLALGLGSMIVGLARFRTAKAYEMPLRTFSALKDATIAYFLGGLVIAPEIYNPLMDH